MTIEYAESFFAWDVLSWLFLAMLLAIVIVLIDLLFFSKKNPYNSYCCSVIYQYLFTNFYSCERRS